MKTEKDKKIYSVSEVNYFAKQTLEQMELWVEGEVTTFKQNPNWRFYYLDLKDDTALLPCVADGSVFDQLSGQELVGQKILAYGFLSLYEPRGQYQFKIKRIEAVGEGVLQKKLDGLIKKLKGEGLFDVERKKEIPAYPKKVCIVTSLGSDAWNDFKRHTVDKFPIIDLVTADVRVQGSKSVPELIKVLPQVDKRGFDVIIITRGGGSLEDLAAFNDEAVARTIFKMKTPTIVAIGHESNESLAEWVADRRASTPTDAASIVTAGYLLVFEKLEGYRFRLSLSASRFFSTNFQTIDNLINRLRYAKITFKDLPHRLGAIKENLLRHQRHLILDAIGKTDQAFDQIRNTTVSILGGYEQRLNNLNRALILLSPQNTLNRGYSITTDVRGHVIKDADSVVIGSTIGVRLANGKLSSRVLGKVKYDKGNR